MRRILGVSFGPDLLAAEIFEYGLVGKKTVKSESIVLPEAAEERDLSIAGALEKWKKEEAPDGAVIGLPLQRFSHQVVDMPAMKRSDVKKALLFELEKHLPLPVDEYLFDFLILPGAPGRAKALVLSVKKEVVRRVTDMVAAAGIAVISVRCNTLSALWGMPGMVGEKNVSGLFVNAVGGGYEISGVKNSSPVYLKFFAKSADLVREIERLAVLYPGGVYFIGNVDAATVERFRGRKFASPVPGALALSALRKSSLNLDFLPEDLMRTGADPYPYLIGGLAAASLAVFLLTGVTVYYKDWSTLKDMEAKGAAIKARAAGVLAERKKLVALRNDRENLRDFLGRSNVAIKVLSELSEVLPKESWLLNIAVDDKGKVEIEGFTAKTASVITALEKSKAFKNVAFSAPILARDGQERFALKMEVEGR
jgi:Tfp pilus assembly protein PilN